MITLRSPKMTATSLIKDRMLRLRVEADLPVPVADEFVSGETAVYVPGTRRYGY